jgi:tyrosinase
MKFLSLFTGLAALSTSVSGFAIPTLDDAIEFAEHTLEKRAFLPVVGAPGSTLPRYEVRQLQTEKPNQWTLFLLAMKQFQAQAQSVKGGYYQVSGIHGQPNVDWDGVGKCSTCTNPGYCPHSSILFLGWHRAYVALFEQQLIKVAKTIANQYPTSTRATMVTAANQLRLPYWDWAAHPPNGSNNLPSSMTNTEVTVNGPTGSVTFTNPLHHHTFTNPAPLTLTPWKNWKVSQHQQGCAVSVLMTR